MVEYIRDNAFIKNSFFSSGVKVGVSIKREHIADLWVPLRILYHSIARPKGILLISTHASK